MAEDNEFLEIVKEINSCKDEIKQASQNIISRLNESKSINDFDNDFLVIMTALGKIGTISGNAYKLNSYADSINNLIFRLRNFSGDWGQGNYLRYLLNQICMIGFDIKKKGKKIEITIPKIEFNFPKFEMK